LFREIFYEQIERYVKKNPCKRADLSIGSLLGNLEAVRLLGLLTGKEIAYLGSIFWTQRTLLTYLLTPWSRVLLEKLTGLQLVKKFPSFYGTRRYLTALTSARHLSLS
jgi:hypothetical protein